MTQNLITIPIGPDHKVRTIWYVPEDFNPGKSDAVILAHKELGRKAPDRPAVLLQTWKAVVQALKEHPTLIPRRLFLGGKSMGSQLASTAVAEGLGCEGLIF